MSTKEKRNNLIIQYTTHIETLKLEDSKVDEHIQSAFRNNAGQVLSITLNSKIIYTKSTI